MAISPAIIERHRPSHHVVPRYTHRLETRQWHRMRTNTPWLMKKSHLLASIVLSAIVVSSLIWLVPAIDEMKMGPQIQIRDNTSLDGIC